MAKIWLINAKKKKKRNNSKSQTFQEIIMNLKNTGANMDVYCFNLMI